MGDDTAVYGDELTGDVLAGRWLATPPGGAVLAGDELAGVDDDMLALFPPQEDRQ